MSVTHECVQAKFVLNINPAPLKRYRFTKTGKTYNPQVQQMKEISFLIKAQCQHFVFTGPISLDVTFFIQIPRSYSKLKKRRLNGKYHTHKKDLDNYVKALADEITMSGIINDDCQFAVINAKKIWTIEGKIEFIIKDI